jgi:hypothetical protein
LQPEQADAVLINQLIALDASYGLDARLYAGGTTFSMTGRLALDDELELLPPEALVAAMQDAVSDLDDAFEKLPRQDIVAARGIVFEPTSEEGAFTFEFEVATASLKQEVIEFVGLNALNDAADFGAVGDAPFDTSSPVSGVRGYQLTFNVVIRDLDFVSV